MNNEAKSSLEVHNDDKSAVSTLVETTGCDHRLARMLLDFTGGDPDGARRIIEAVPKDIFALKFKFITQITGYYGVVFFCYDKRENRIKRLMAVVTDEKEIGKMDIKKDWHQLEQELYQYARNRRVDGLKIENLKDRINQREFVSKLSGIFKIGKQVNHDQLNNLLVDELYNIFTDTNIAVKFDVQMTDAFELNKALPGEEAEQHTEQDQEEKPSSESSPLEKDRREQTLIVLRTEPVLSPVSGVEIGELEFGDEIQVRITDEREIGDYLAQLLGAKVDNLKVPIFTRIVEVKPLEGDSVGVITQFGPGIMGMFKISSDARVVSRKEGQQEPAFPESPRRDIKPALVIGGIVVVIVLFVLLIVLSS
ncbi:MAG: hypothetical protein ACOC7U_02630 [Spirochaetota bacterium]